MLNQFNTQPPPPVVHSPPVSGSSNVWPAREHIESEGTSAIKASKVSVENWGLSGDSEIPELGGFPPFLRGTPRKTNMEPENEPLEEEIPNLETIIFRFYVSFLGGKTVFVRTWRVSTISVKGEKCYLSF